MLCCIRSEYFLWKTVWYELRKIFLEITVVVVVIFTNNYLALAWLLWCEWENMRKLFFCLLCIYNEKSVNGFSCYNNEMYKHFVCQHINCKRVLAIFVKDFHCIFSFIVKFLLFLLLIIENKMSLLLGIFYCANTGDDIMTII